MADFTHQFPISASQVYLNHCAVSPIPCCSADAIARYAREACDEGLTAFPRWIEREEEARRQGARLLNADPCDVAFVKSTTHGLQIVAHSLTWRAGDVIIAEENAFPANLYPWKSLEKRFGVRLVLWQERDYAYRLEDLEALLKAHPVRMVAVTGVHYATGFRHDLAAVGRLARGAGALFCVDAIQWLGAIPFDVPSIQPDFASADGHKWLLGPEGCALFYVRRERLSEMNDSCCGWLGRTDPTSYGSSDLPPHPDARRFEEGSPNHVGMQGLGASLALLNEVGIEEVWRHVRENCRVLEEGMARLGWTQVSPRDEAHASGIVSFRHDSKDPAALARELMKRGISLSARRGWLRLAPHFYQTSEQMERVLDELRAHC